MGDYGCVQGRPAAFQPPITLLWRDESNGPSKPSEILKQGVQPAFVIAMAVWRERAPDRQRNINGAPCLTPALSNMPVKREGKFPSTCIEGKLCHSR